MPMLSLLGASKSIPFFYMAKSFIFHEEIKERINWFSNGYIFNPRLNINKAFREQVHKYMNNKLGRITQPYIRATLSKKKNSVSIINVL